MIPAEVSTGWDCAGMAPDPAHAADFAARVQAHQLVSLWDMLRVYASFYSTTLVALSLHERQLREAEKQGEGGDAVGEQHAEMVRRELDILAAHARLGGDDLEGVQFQVAYARHHVGPGSTVGEAAEALAGVRLAAVRDLSRFRLYHVPRSLAPLYEEPLVEWKSVVGKYPDTEPDIREAGRCLALGLPTACVFHLMRVAEFGLRAAAGADGLRVRVVKTKGNPHDKQKIRVTVPHELAEWGDILGAIDGKLAQLRKRTRGKSAAARQIAFYSQVKAELHAFKDAWRNHVSHARDSYDVHQAQSVYTHVREFMARLAAGPP
ncbi:hypothetical protein tb265_42910 [Gemmatimonadetes bacterium T265]|nr:hypothetical protein tb265_42910 [Gemmatimonadetes bacterium T265]